MVCIIVKTANDRDELKYMKSIYIKINVCLYVLNFKNHTTNHREILRSFLKIRVVF